ncbi:DUF4190 domain-containing protein [Dactylosporangium sp. CS-033363]|uniref:DUF4190 domain-containing protein n=1 Tax=Dactylosporangium sp. CS-033363 TaxID=3239935 RepID=UPI003D94CD28
MHDTRTPPARSDRVSGTAVAGLVLGILSVCGAFMRLPLWVLALIFSMVGLSVCRRHGFMGRGMAAAGLVLGFVSLGLMILIGIARG